MNQMTKTPMYYINRMAEIQKRKGAFNEDQAYEQAQKRCVQIMQMIRCPRNFSPVMKFQTDDELKDAQEEQHITSQLQKLAGWHCQSLDLYMEEQRRTTQDEIFETQKLQAQQTLQALDEPAAIWWVTDRPFNPREWENNVYLKPANKWWDFYRGEDNVLISEITIQEARDIYDLLKMWGDITPFKADAKYKFWKPDGPFIRPKKCVVRSNYTIDQVFGNDEAMKCRFKEIKDDSFHIDALLLF